MCGSEPVESDDKHDPDGPGPAADLPARCYRIFTRRAFAHAESRQAGKQTTPRRTPGWWSCGGDAKSATDSLRFASAGPDRDARTSAPPTPSHIAHHPSYIAHRMQGLLRPLRDHEYPRCGRPILANNVRPVPGPDATPRPATLAFLLPGLEVRFEPSRCPDEQPSTTFGLPDVQVGLVALFRVLGCSKSWTSYQGGLRLHRTAPGSLLFRRV